MRRKLATSAYPKTYQRIGLSAPDSEFKERADMYAHRAVKLANKKKLQKSKNGA